jgi:hypothetical protein
MPNTHICLGAWVASWPSQHFPMLNESGQALGYMSRATTMVPSCPNNHQAMQPKIPCRPDAIPRAWPLKAQRVNGGELRRLPWRARSTAWGVGELLRRYRGLSILLLRHTHIHGHRLTSPSVVDFNTKLQLYSCILGLSSRLVSQPSHSIPAVSTVATLRCTSPLGRGSLRSVSVGTPRRTVSSAYCAAIPACICLVRSYVFHRDTRSIRTPLVEAGNKQG